MNHSTCKKQNFTKTKAKSYEISYGELISRLLAFAILAVSVFYPQTAGAIERVAPLPEVGRHLVQGSVGLAGSSEDAAEGTGLAWSALYSYHANNPFGLAFAVGQNEPEDFDGTTRDASGFIISSGRFNNKFTYFVGGVDIRSPTRSGFVPFIQGLFGIYQIDFLSPGARFETDEFGMLFGGGVDYLVTKRIGVGFVGNLHYVSLDDEIQAEQPLGDWFNTWDIKGVITIYMP